jgi:hypothetical protein
MYKRRTVIGGRRVLKAATITDKMTILWAKEEGREGCKSRNFSAVVD